MWDIEVQGDITTVYIFSIVSLLILLIACFNFMSLSTALAGTRSLEVGIRKTVGSNRGNLIWQFIGESIITAVISFIISLGIIQIILPSFNSLTDKTLSLSIFSQPDKLLILIAIVFGTGFISGIYPSFYLSAVKPIAVLKGRLIETRGKFSFRQILVVLQFAISIALIIGTLTALKQMNYVQSKPLGYEKDNLMVLKIESTDVLNGYESFKSDLLKNPIIESVASSGRVPAEREYSDTGWETDIQDDVFLSRLFPVNFDFLETYKVEMAAGRNFKEDFATDKNFKVIINETAVKKLGYENAEDAIGDKFHADWIAENIDSLSQGQIVGVMKDFHFQSLKNKIEPLAIYIYKDWMSRITVGHQPGKTEETINFVEATWNDHFPDVQFTYSFITDYLTTFYKAEEKLQTILLVFTTLAIIIACLGLFGLAIFIAQQRVKEIGVRKAMGASIGSIVMLLSKSFTKWVIIANILAWPIAWYFLEEWLSNFQYRIDIDVWLFFISGFLALIIALITISYRSYVAALKNPIDSLRYE
jgi:putative ABC transport system permease protein